MYSCQFTMLRVKLLFFRPYIIMLALTDFDTQKHYYFQNITLSERDTTINEHMVAFGKTAAVQKQANGMRLTVDHKDFGLDLTLGYGKRAIWHCDNGLIQIWIGVLKILGFIGVKPWQIRFLFQIAGAAKKLSSLSETEIDGLYNVSAMQYLSIL